MRSVGLASMPASAVPVEPPLAVEVVMRTWRCDSSWALRAEGTMRSPLTAESRFSRMRWNLMARVSPGMAPSTKNGPVSGLPPMERRAFGVPAARIHGGGLHGVARIDVKHRRNGAGKDAMEGGGLEDVRLGCGSVGSSPGVPFQANSSSGCFTVPSISSPCIRPSNLPHSFPSGRVAVMCKRSPSTVPWSFNSFKVPVILLPSALSSTRAAANCFPEAHQVQIPPAIDIRGKH